MKKRWLSVLLSAAMAVSAAGGLPTTAVAADTDDTTEEVSPPVLKELYEAEDAEISGAQTGDTLDDYHGTGYVADMATGNAVTFTVDVPTEAKYGVKLRYSNGTGETQTISLYVNDEKVRTVNLAAGINENTWEYQTEAVDLPAGESTITYQVDSGDSGKVSIDRIAMSWLYEAEEAVHNGVGQDNTDMHPGYSGDGFVSGYNNKGYGRTFTVNVPEAGEYTLVMRYAAGQEDSACRTVSMFINGGERQQVKINSLRSWDIWWDHISTVQLQEGENEITIMRWDDGDDDNNDNDDNGEINLDYITVKPVQWTYAGAVESVEGSGTSQLTFQLDNAAVQITSVAENVVKVWLEPDSRFERKYDSFSVSSDDLNQQVLDPEDKGDYYEIDLGDMDMRIQKDPFKITYLDKEGNVIVENENQSMGWTTDGELMVNNKIKENEAYWGLGEKPESNFNRRGEKVYMWAVDAWGAELDDSFPSWEEGRYYSADTYFMSSEGYSIFFDNTSRTVFDMGKTDPNTCSFGSLNPNPGGELCYYFIYGGQEEDYQKQLTKTYTDLIGKSFFAPNWALGNIQCHYGYRQDSSPDLPQGEDGVETVARKYRENEIPLDAIMVDIEWYEYLCTPTDWNDRNFPDPEGMLQTLADLNVRFGVIDDPNVTNRDNNADFVEGDTNGYFVKNRTGNTKLITWPWGGASGLVDFFNPEAREWWGEQHDMILGRGEYANEDGSDALGAVCFWLDMSEPAKYNADWLFWNEEGKSWGNLSEVKNALGMFHHIAMYDKVTENNQRTLLLARTTIPGDLKYVSPWTGDIQSSWESMNQQINNGISMSTSGYNYWGFDITGFFSDVTDEQYARWLELATFTPIHRIHYMTGGPKEPYTHNATEVAQKYIGLRYSLMPYMYSLIADNIMGIGIEEGLGEGGTGVPMTRSLVMNYPSDENTWNLDTEYMSGDSFLIAPMLVTGDQRDIYLPEGDHWYDYDDGKSIYAGGQTLFSYHAPTDLLPIFVKEGSIIPMQPEMQYVGEKPVDEITLDIYPTVEDGDFHFVMYEDDGETMDYQKGEYTTTRYDANVKYTGANRTLTLDIGERTGSYTDIAERDYLVKLHDGYMTNASVTYDGAALTAYGSLEDLEAAETGYFMDSADRLCYVKVPDTAKAATIVIAGETVDRNIYEAEDGELLGNAAVDTDIDGFSGTGYVTNLTTDGDGVTIGSVLVDAAGRYDLTIRYANSESEALTAHISADDGEGQQISFPATEGAWNEMTISMVLKDGRNNITIEILPEDKGGMAIDSVSPGAYPAWLDEMAETTSQAEDASLSGGAATGNSTASYTGTGYVQNLTAAGATVTFENVTAPADGDYTVYLRYSATDGNQNKTIHVYAGDDASTAVQVTLPAFHAGDLWNDYGVTLPLKAGDDNTITVTVEEGDTGDILLDGIHFLNQPRTQTALPDAIVNGDFETGNRNGWTLEDGGLNGAGCGVDAGDAARGGYKFYFYYDKSANSQRLSQEVTGLEDGLYRLEFVYKIYNTAFNTCRVELTGYDGDAATYADLPYNNRWDSFAVEAEVKDGTLNIAFYGDTPGGSSLQLDEIKLYKVEEQALEKADLQRLADEAGALTEADYTAESWAVLAMHLQNAEDVLDASAPADTQLFEAISRMQYALRNLETAGEVPPEPTIIKGDVNGDKKVDIVDVMGACRILARKNTGTDPTDEEKARVDMNEDNDIDISDIMSICRVIARESQA